MDNQLAELTEHFRALGADDPESWARSEVHENIPQMATFLLLRQLWVDCIQPWRDPDVLNRVNRTKALLDGGAHPDDVSAAMCLAAYEAVFGVLSNLDAGGDPEVRQDDDIDRGGPPSWAVVEISPKGEPTGRHMDGLYESLLSLDPTRGEGSDFL